MSKGNSNILTINCGSSSIKFAIYEMVEVPKMKISGKINRIGLNDSGLTINHNNEKNSSELGALDFQQATAFLIGWLKKQEETQSIKCIGHRIVYGFQYAQPKIIDEKLLEELDRMSLYDPDHLPAEIEIIELFQKHFPDLLQVACFDTTFHTSLPSFAKMFAIPRNFYERGIQRYGFHGISYSYLMEELKEKTGDVYNKRIILAHLGNGASLAAVKNGKCIDTTMGFTPAGGIAMSTRSGDIDPGIAWYFMKNGMDEKQFNDLVNHRSGLLGISETNSNMHDLLAIENDDTRAAEAVALFCYQVKKSIGAFTAALSGLDVLVFSGGIGENSPVIRSRICEGLLYLGIELDEEQNKKNAFQISTEAKAVKVYVIPTNEELMIAKTAAQIFQKLKLAIQ